MRTGLLTLLFGAVLVVPVSGAAASKIPDVDSHALTEVNIRYGPGVQYELAGKLRRGEAVQVDSILNGWCMINSSEGMFVQCRYLAPPRGGWVEGRTVSRSCWPNCGD